MSFPLYRLTADSVKRRLAYHLPYQQWHFRPRPKHPALLRYHPHRQPPDRRVADLRQPTEALHTLLASPAVLPFFKWSRSCAVPFPFALQTASMIPTFGTRFLPMAG